MDIQNFGVIHSITDQLRLVGPPGPTPRLKHLQLVAQAHIQMVFEYIQGWTLHNLFVHGYQGCFGKVTSTTKKSLWQLLHRYMAALEIPLKGKGHRTEGVFSAGSN